MTTVTAALWHDCRCGASFGLDGSRATTPSDLQWWLEELAEHGRCA